VDTALDRIGRPSLSLSRRCNDRTNRGDGSPAPERADAARARRRGKKIPPAFSDGELPPRCVRAVLTGIFLRHRSRIGALQPVNSARARRWNGACTGPRCDVDEALAGIGQPMASLEAAVRQYCSKHPNCADTIEGVRRWWLGDLTIPIADLERALERLVELGALERRLLADGTTIYLHRA
jgi:hypothetical protein